MACPHLDRHLEDRILDLDTRRELLPWWAWLRRRRLQARIHSIFDILHAARKAAGA